MDEDDSQDELINFSTSQSKGKRAALWAISDDSDDAEEESEGAESESGEDEEEDHLDGGEDEEEGNEEDDDEEEEEEEDAKSEEGAIGGTSADLAGMSSDEEAEKCPICLNSFNSQPVATPENCAHYYCLDCILEWAKNANLCPIDRINFNSIHLRKCYGGKVQKVITVQKPVKQTQQDTIDLDLEQTSCEVCGGSDREDRLLLCDGCDAGYHMECLTPPLDAVPVEEWFCPECEANNRQSRGSAEEPSDTESLPSTAHPTSSRSQSRFAGPTRAIARTQHSERVRANVNRHRITQARTSQLAPTYLIQSTWLDETINAVVAGLNTAVYVRDFTPRFSSTRRRRQTGKRRKVKSKNPSSGKGKKGKAASTGVKRRKRRVRKTKSRKRLMLKKTPTTRSRIANSLGIVKDKKSSSLPTVYRPSEHTLSSMRADIGAASLSIYGDPFDLDPFVEREEDEQHARVSSLLEAKRRGISRSAFRSHQPVARPVTASLSRRGVDVPQSGGVVEAAPVPDLLGSILSGQSMLLMDSSDVVINRDGSLKTTKPMSLSSSLKPSCSKSSSSGDITTSVDPGMSPSHVDISSSLQYDRDLPGTSESSLDKHFSQSSSRFPPLTASMASHSEPALHSDLPPRGHPSLQTPHPRGPTPRSGHRGINGVRDRRETISSSSHLSPDSSSKSKGRAPSQSQPKKAPTKPMWVDVSVLPRIPKIKRERSVSADDATSQGGSSGNNRGSSSRASSSSSTTSINSYGMPETGINSLAGDKGRQHSVDQQQGRTDGQAQRHRPDGAGSSSSFSNSFSSSSSSTGSHASQPRCSSSSSSSLSVSFRISSSGNSWHSRRLSVTSSTASRGSMQEHRKQKEDEARKRQLHRDKQMLLASHTPVSKEEDSNNIYDPFNPTVSDSSSSESEGESTSLESTSRLATLEGKSPSLGKEEYLVQSKQDSVQVKAETEESPVSQGEPRTAAAQETVSWDLGCSKEDIKVEQESRLVDSNIEKQTALLKTTIKKEPDDAGKAESCGHSVKRYLDSGTEETTQPVHHHRWDLLKTEKEIQKQESGHNTGTPNVVSPNSRKTSPASSSTQTEKKQETEMKSEPRSKSPSKDSGYKKKTSKKHVPSKEQRTRSSSSETDRCRRGDRIASTQGGSQKGKDKDRVKSSRRSRSKERRRAHTSSDSSQSNSPDRTSRKRRRSRSRSKNRRRSRSGSSSSSRERSRGKKHKQRSKERYDGRDRDHERRRAPKDKRRDWSQSKSRSRSRSRSRDNRRGRSRSKSQSRSRTRSRSRERRKDQTSQHSSQHSAVSSRDRVESRSREQRRGRSRSSSREKRKEDGSSKSSQKTPGSCTSSSKDTKPSKDKKKDKDCPVKEEKVAKMSKQETSSTSASKVKKESSDLKADGQVAKADMVKKEKIVKEIKKEPLFDMFEDSPINKPVKEEEIDIPLSMMVPEFMNEEETKKDPVKAEACETTTVKSEPGSPVPSFSTVTTSPPPAVCAPLTASPLLQDTAEEPDTDVLPVHVKQEAQQPSDSDDDFNVDVMLDNLDFVKSESADGRGASVKQEKEGEEVKSEGEQVLAAVGAKSKTQVKRVTWNIQEPEGPQPEKSASKVALYKLKLKQEGVRRPSSAVPASTQDIAGAASVTDSSKKAGAGPQISSRSDSTQPEDLSTTGQSVAEEGDLSRKDKYLKKLHMQERAIEEVKLAIKPFYQRRDINKDEYKEILRKAVQKVCHSKSGEINPVKVGNLVKAYVDKYKHARKHKKGEDSGKSQGPQSEAMKTSDSP